MTVKAQELMKEEGVVESLLSIMEGINQIFPAKVENQEYKQYVAAYITLRSQGQSHDQAVSGLRALIGSHGSNILKIYKRREPMEFHTRKLGSFSALVAQSVFFEV